MNTFHFNNSSLSYLSCAKRYYFQVVKGLKPPPGGNKYTKAGLAFHKMMQLIGGPDYPSMTMAAMFSKDKLPPLVTSVPEAQQLTLANACDKIFNEHPELFQEGSLREHWFEYQLREEFCVKDWVAGPCGTIDNISIINGTLVLTDYKTTSKPIDPALVSAYKLTSQRFFYQLAALIIDLPESFAALRDSLSIAWRYCYVHAETGDYYLEEPQLLNVNELTYFRGLIYDKAILAAALHADSTLALKEGILTGQCWKCPFSQICLAADEEAAVQSWYYGSQPYNPKHDE